VKHSKKFRRKSVLLLLCLAGFGQACARPDAFRRSDAGSPPSGAQKLPFHPSSDHSADDNERPAVPSDPKPANSTPFRGPAQFHSSPAGTLVTVQLDRSFSLGKVQAGDSFTASLAGPVTVNGGRLIERGAPVVGMVESTQPAVYRSGGSSSPSLIRLTLSSILVDGHPLAVQTSSLFAKGRALDPNASSKDFELPKGHEFTFRLTAPATISDANSIADRQYSDSTQAVSTSK
jgi:hypothetical protein